MPRKPHSRPDAVRRHPIQVVVRRTGLSADVLRAWERRYEIVAPERSAGGRRLYSDDDIALLRLLRRATEGGRSIGQLTGLDAAALVGLIREDEVAAPAPPASGAEGPVEHADVVRAALDDIAALDSRRLHERLQRAMVDLAAPTFLDDVITPLLDQIGRRRAVGDLPSSHGHLGSAAILRVLHQFLTAMLSSSAQRGLVAATPQGVRHECGAMLVAATGALIGWDATCLGADLPAAEIAGAVRLRRAEVVALSIVPPFDQHAVLAELTALRAAIPRPVVMILVGAAADALREALEPLGILTGGDLPAFRRTLESLNGVRT